MKLYKTSTDEIFAYEEDGSQDYLIGDKISITQEEADAIIKAQFNSLPQAAPLTPAEKLASVGLTISDLKELLGVKL
jgi:hypothetical protein